ncbi:MAG: CocE/NonD family hydrolase C-terminal non-catalytic domain-containing protein [Steroidobacteraceae bacterium]
MLAQATSVRYDEHHLTDATELTGYVKLRLWLEAQGPTTWTFSWPSRSSIPTAGSCQSSSYAMNENGPIALGWLRMSHRELDESRSRPERPAHLAHRRAALDGGGESSRRHDPGRTNVSAG